MEARVPTLAGEIWKGIPDWEYYLVSNLGRVYSVRSKILMKQHQDRHGYSLVSLKVNGRSVKRYVSRFMLLAFRPVSGVDELEAAHLDGNPSNNVLANLAWKTPLGNAADRKIHGTEMYGRKNPSARITPILAMKIRAMACLGVVQRKLAGQFGVSQQLVSEIKLGRLWSHV